ncbi:MAG: biotin synthase BioB [Gammaproteobacteria bacterium]
MMSSHTSEYLFPDPVQEFPRLRHDWSTEESEYIYSLPFLDLLLQAQSIHRRYFKSNTLQLSTLLNIKTGGCPEDCAYCPQSARYGTSVKTARLLDVATVTEAAEKAKRKGATRFCMGAAWRNPRKNDLERVLEMVRAVKSLGLETCATLGMLTAEQAEALKGSGLDYYNHNLDTSRAFYPRIITTRTYDDRLRTLQHVRAAGMRVCCGGIIGMGESHHDRCALLMTLANLPEHPESVPINLLVRVEGTPLGTAEVPDPFDMVRTIALARILMPASYVRLSAGRSSMSDELQALCFLAGANSVFYGEQLLTTENPAADQDRRLFQRLGIAAV